MPEIRQKINRKKDCFLEYKRFDFDIILRDSPYMFNNKKKSRNMTNTKIRIFHKAFENEISHVATMKMPTNKNIDETLEYVFKRTQNLNDLWITENVGFNMLPTVETRSTSCGDIIEILNQNNTSNLYVVMGKGFKKVTPQTYNEISILKDNELAQYFFNCNRSKDIDIKSIKKTKIKLDNVA